MRDAQEATSTARKEMDDLHNSVKTANSKAHECEANLREMRDNLRSAKQELKRMNDHDRQVRNTLRCCTGLCCTVTNAGAKYDYAKLSDHFHY